MSALKVALRAGTLKGAGALRAVLAIAFGAPLVARLLAFTSTIETAFGLPLTPALSTPRCTAALVPAGPAPMARARMAVATKTRAWMSAVLATSAPRRAHEDARLGVLRLEARHLRHRD